MIICPECSKGFDPADRAASTANAGSEAQILYCCIACQRRARNRRNYQRHREERIAAVIQKRKLKASQS